MKFCRLLLVAIVASAIAGQAAAVETAGPPVVPRGHACLPPNGQWPFCNTSLSVEERVAWLLSNLTTLEKLGLIGADPAYNACPLVDAGVARLGIPKYMWLDETNTGIASGCAAPGRCATTFPSPAGLAASFNRSVWRMKGEILSTEQRAMNNLHWTRFSPNQEPFFIGVDGFGPNINMVRDPRWGRNDEVPSEDPFLAGHYAANYVRGMQEGPDQRYIKMIAFLKHYTAYSVETNRAAFNANISTFDFYDTFVAQFEIAFTQGRASGAMCSYASVNGVPSCANPLLLTELLRNKWGMEDSVITTDCGAVSNMYYYNHFAANLSDAAAKSLNAGTDLNTETVFSGLDMIAAIATGETNVSMVDRALRRSLKLRFRAGLFDPVVNQPYTTLGLTDIATPAHRHQNYDSALQSFVLLRNDGNAVLPLKAKSQKIAVLGPKISSTMTLLEQYYGDQVCYGGGFDCITTLAQAMQSYGGGSAYVTPFQAINVTGSNASLIPEALAIARTSDVIVLALGLDRQVEGETVDRTNTDLPGLQASFAQQVLSLGIPTVVVFINGGMISFDNILNTKTPLAIVEAFYPGFEGANALACTLFGCANRWGKLPVTIYPTTFQSEANFYSFDMTAAPGRTYRYYQGTPLYPFGWGLSYTNFSYNCSQLFAAFQITCTVSNVGVVDGDEVVLAFHRVSSDIRAKWPHPFPKKNIVGFERLFIKARSSATVVFDFAESAFESTNNEGARRVYQGLHYVEIGSSPAQFTASWTL
jgi:beta-D-xylosidase 4